MTEVLELGAVISFGVLVKFVRRSCASSFLLKTGYVFFLVFLDSGDRALS